MVGQRSSDFFAEYQQLTRTAANEEELRSRFDTAARTTLDIHDLKLERGRKDIRRNRVIIEFKAKGLFLGTRTSARFQEARAQLVEDYIPHQAAQDGREPSDYIGICFDGVHFAFVFVEPDGRNRVTDLRPFDKRSVGALVLALDQDDRIELTSQNVDDDFGPGSAVAGALLGALWEHLNSSLAAHVNRVEMLYVEWNDLFEQSTNLGRIGRARLDSYLTSIGLPDGSDPTRVLFVLHTYHALFFKLLAAEVVLANTLLPGTPSDYCFSAATLDDDQLLASLEEHIEDSELFRQVNILNFVEGSFFSWYLVNPPSALITAIRAIMQRVSLYRLRGLELGRTRDIVKRVYQQLVPAALRHNIGEYFTPEWLVEFTLDRAAYRGPDILQKKYLDPCCGSGNFLIHAISRYKAYARADGWDDAKILQGILDHIFGFDLNPLAVLTARVNYLLAISDLIGTHSEVEIPVYQADAVYAPTINATNGTAAATLTYPVGTRMQTIALELPETLIQRNRLFARVLEIMERAVHQGDPEQVFVATLNNEPAYVAESERKMWEPLLLDMFRKVQQLERSDWDRIWCRIVRNYFASVAVGKCQVVASNPPWVRWAELPERYRTRIQPTCQDYGIFSQDRYFGGNELDISGMITYSVADKWLDDRHGRLSFVITQTHFQSQSSGGFRRFEVKGTPLKVHCVDDFVDVRPFGGLGNSPTVLSMEKGRATTYPLRYLDWERTAAAAIPEDEDWSTAQTNLAYTELEANPLSGPGQRWCILPPGDFDELCVLDGQDPYISGRKGIVTDLNGAYFVELLGPGRLPNTVRVRNKPEIGRKPVPHRTDDIELDLIYPLIKGGGNIRTFHATTSPLYAIVPNKGITTGEIPTVTSFATRHPGALRYFRAINADGLLEQRSTWRTRMRLQWDRYVQQGRTTPEDIPCYAIYDVGRYTFTRYKVVWAEIAGTLAAGVISSATVPYGGGSKPIVPDHKVYFAAFDDFDYAHYVCALLNSEPVRAFIDSFTIKLQFGTLFRHIRLPAYDSTIQDHVDLAHLSQQAHQARLAEAPIGRHRMEIDQIAGKLLLNAV